MWFVNISAILLWIMAVALCQTLSNQLSGMWQVVPYFAVALLCVRVWWARFRCDELTSWRILFAGSLTLTVLLMFLHNGCWLSRDQDNSYLLNNVLGYGLTAAFGLLAYRGAVDRKGFSFKFGTAGLVGCLLFFLFMISYWMARERA